jgi:hypothetical protein
MSILTPPQRSFLESVSKLSYANPFLPERIELEHACLGPDFVEVEAVWSFRADHPGPRDNVWRIVERLAPIVEQASAHLRHGESASPRELELYEDSALHVLYQRFYYQFHSANLGDERTNPARWRFYNEFLADWRRLLAIDGITLPNERDPRHTFAWFRQIQRAFDIVFRDIIGSALPAAQLRGAVWQSIFTHNMRRYRRTLFSRMGEFATLITGPSGTGKELVARAIAESRYLPFDERRLVFPAENEPVFLPINISALSPTLVESELFGHKRGAFTGATADRIGYLESCPELGCVFLDELGDMDPGIQVKLLRVIETRTFHPVGDTSPRQFRGKLIAATHRDLARAMRKGQFREDLYYRLCSDQVTTPSLADQLAASPGGLRELAAYMARRVAGPEADALAAEVLEWIGANLGDSYAWPGNYRELEQCVKNVLIRRNYRPAHSSPSDPLEDLLQRTRDGALTAEELLCRYTTLVYSRTGSYEETARRLGLDRRTVKAKVDGAMLARLRGQGAASHSEE